jgi:hypothetical protein
LAAFGLFLGAGDGHWDVLIESCWEQLGTVEELGIVLFDKGVFGVVLILGLTFLESRLFFDRGWIFVWFMVA